MVFGSLTTIDIGILLSVATFMFIVFKSNNKRLKEKADCTELEKFKNENKEQHSKLEQDMKEHVKLKVESIREINVQILSQVKYMVEKLDNHIDNVNKKK